MQLYWMSGGLIILRWFAEICLHAAELCGWCCRALDVLWRFAMVPQSTDMRLAMLFYCTIIWADSKQWAVNKNRSVLCIDHFQIIFGRWMIHRERSYVTLRDLGRPWATLSNLQRPWATLGNIGDLGQPWGHLMNLESRKSMQSFNAVGLMTVAWGDVWLYLHETTCVWLETQT